LFTLIPYTADDDLDCACVGFEEGLERLLGFVEFEAVGDEFLCVNKTTTKEIRSIYT